MSKAYIIGGLRTPIGKTGGILKDFLPEELAAHVISETLKKFKLQRAWIDQVLLGNAVGPGGNIARVSALQAKLPEEIPATTVDMQCGGGLSSMILGASLIESGFCDLLVAGGVESTSMEITKLYNKRDPRYGDGPGALKRAPFVPHGMEDPDMLRCAAYTALDAGIDREEMDNWAYKSHKRASSAQQNHSLSSLIAPICTKDGQILAHDESVRSKLSLKLLKRAPVLLEEGAGITAGNSCLTHDGAAVVILASQSAVEKYALTPQAEFTRGVHAGVNPRLSPMGAAAAISKLVEKQNMSIEQVDAIEINEAFAVKVAACQKLLGLSEEKTNILGGALAYGHPYGASGTIIVLHLMEVLKHMRKDCGIAAIGIAGGQGAAAMIKMLR